MGVRLVCVGDIHGELEKLDDVLSKNKLKDDEYYVFIGDYIDRGSDSLGVIRRLMSLDNSYFLIGNHDYVFLNNINLFSSLYGLEYNYDDYIDDLWVILEFQLEGYESFLKDSPYKNSINKVRSIISGSRDESKMLDIIVEVSKYIYDNFQEELKFIQNCIVYMETTLHVISHSGGNTELKIGDNSLDDWTSYRCESKKDFGKIRIYGHTPTISGKVEIDKLSIKLDTGADFRGIPIGVFKTNVCEIVNINYLEDFKSLK